MLGKRTQDPPAYTVGKRSSERHQKGCIFRFFADFGVTSISLKRLAAPKKRRHSAAGDLFSDMKPFAKKKLRVPLPCARSFFFFVFWQLKGPFANH